MNFDMTTFIYLAVAVVCSALVSYTMTPPVRLLAFRIGAIDIPLDARRMHKKPTPRIGGLAMFAGFMVATFVFCDPSSELYALWIGGAILVILGIIDDIFRLSAWIKLLVQLCVAGIAVCFGVLIDHVTLFGFMIEFGYFSIPITILWIVGLSNAINLIDGLDGLACGVSAITAVSVFTVMLITGDYTSALLTAILIGACLGFLPYNRNPARIFMGDTGSLFLGGLVVGAAFLADNPLIVIICGLVYICETASDILQVGYFKLTHGKRLFKMAPIHHHFEQCGWSERKIVAVFTVATVLFCAAAWFGL